MYSLICAEGWSADVLGIVCLVFMRLAPVSSYQVALVFVHGRGGVIVVEVGLERVVRCYGVGASGGGTFDGAGHVERRCLGDNVKTELKDKT